MAAREHCKFISLHNSQDDGSSPIDCPNEGGATNVNFGLPAGGVGVGKRLHQNNILTYYQEVLTPF
jgi:hypothetical protein